MGYIRGIIHGTVIGTVVGLCVAPQDGARTRAQLSQVARAAREGYRSAERTVRKMSPVVSPLVARVRHSSEDDAETETGTVRIHDHTNGHSRH